MRLISVIASFILLSSLQAYSQMLIINEVSQGSGTKEYVEFIVAGMSTCQTPVPCADLRGVIIDDNNGTFATGSGTGIAPGAVRFANNAFWSCVPQGTIIVVYNDLDRNPAIPVDDLTMNDGNCKLIIPVNSNLFEGQSVGPTINDLNYPANASWIAGAGSWNQIAMANSDDSFCVTMNNNNTASYFAVSWGNNTTSNYIYFSGSASGKVFSMTNTTSTNIFIQSNWTSGNVGTDETPGVPNSTQNQAWIGSMNPTCYGVPSMDISFNVTPSVCGSNCTGAASGTVTGGISPYSYSWSTGATSASISNQCSGNYDLTVTDAGGCSHTESVTITQNSSLTATINPTDETCSGECDGQAVGNATGGTAPYTFSWSNNSTNTSISNLCPGNYSLTVTDQNGCANTAFTIISGGLTPPSSAFNDPGTHLITDGLLLIPTNSVGTWASECGNCISTNGVFDPAVSGVGTFEVCFTTATGSCTSTSCDEITIILACTDQQAFLNYEICAGEQVQLNGETYTTPGQYEQHFTVNGGCDSALYITVSPCLITDYTLEIPNVITPNGDQTNDLWTVDYSNITFEKGSILNRWGQVIQNLSGPIVLWDGKTADSVCTEGVYFYQLQFRSVTGEVIEKQGFIELYK